MSITKQQFFQVFTIFFHTRLQYTLFRQKETQFSCYHLPVNVYLETHSHNLNTIFSSELTPAAAAKPKQALPWLVAHGNKRGFLLHLHTKIPVSRSVTMLDRYLYFSITNASYGLSLILGAASCSL